MDPRKGRAEVWRVPARSNETLAGWGRMSPRWGVGMGSTLRQLLQFPGGCRASLGSHMAGSTTLDVNHQDPQRPTGLPDFKEECRKGGGRIAFSGVILDHCHACPEPPLQSVLAKQGKASSLEPLRGCGLWREARLQALPP